MNETMRALGAAVCVAIALSGAPALAQGQATVMGTIVDALGARISGAKVTLVRDGSSVAEATTGADGTFTFASVAPGRYQVAASAQGFSSRTSEPVFVGGGSREQLEVALDIGPLQQDVVVTAQAGEVLQARTGAQVTVIDSSTLDALNKPDVLEALRLVPGSQIVQVGERGGPTSMFLRGGNSNFTKVLVDGVPANDIGGGFDFSQLDVAGVDRVEVMRETNSVVYGSDALTGVVNITTRRGATHTPELEYAIDGGNLDTVRNAIGLGGAARRVDYFSQYAYLTTDNNTPNSGYHRGTYAGRIGVALSSGTNLSGTLRRADGSFGSANAFDLYRVADDATQDTDLTYGSIAADSQFTNRWQTTVRFGSAVQTIHRINPTPSGEPFDPFGFGANYIGQTVTLEGANGERVTGRAILDYNGRYPSTFFSRTTRRTLFGQTTYQATPALAISGGARYEREAGFDTPEADASATRNNGGAFVEARASLANRAYVSGGVGVEHNAVFGNEATPRVSIAVYVRNPSNGSIGETKLTVNAGKGIKAPSVFQEHNALFALVQGTPAGAAVQPVGPERSRSFDVGIEQGFAGGRLRARVGYFTNEFDDLLEFLSRTALVTAGVPPAVAAATAFGAYVNSSSYTAQGVEASFEAMAWRALRVSGSYTYLDAEVTKAFSASASFNPSLPGVPIGAFSPLVGARPFRRPANSGTLLVAYTQGKAQVALSGYFSGARDDSTFLSDQFFGNSLLLPNTDLDPAYQKIDLSGGYYVHPRLRLYTTIENLFDRKFDAAFGFPALPFTIRAGASITIAGDR
jgi:vitamin B12 transporter